MNPDLTNTRQATSQMVVRYSIGAKLITIISILVLVSLGSITALVSWLVRQDLRISAEDNNFEVNRRSSMETENTLTNMRSNSILLLQTVNALEAGSTDNDNSLSSQTVEMFFEQNPQVGFVLYTAGGKEEELHLNDQFFLTREIDPEPAKTFYKNQEDNLIRAATGETLIINMTPFFKTSVLALFFPFYNGAGAVLFSPANLNDSFGYGPNQSYVINDAGDILIHPDYEMIRSASNVAEKDFTKFIWVSPQRNAQVLYTDENDIRYFGAFTRLNTAGCTVVTSIEYEKVFEGINATTRRNIYLTTAVLSISILLIWFFSKTISIPIKALASAAKNIESGAFEVNLKPRGNDEIGFLTKSFQQMCTALSIFGKFTNRQIAVRAMRGEIIRGGSPKLATIFFSDIRGFTQKSADFTNEFGDNASDHIIQWLNNYLSRMVECIEKTSGVVDKFIGDAIMAHWGTVYTSGSPERDAFNCIFSALMMRKALYEMNKTRREGDISNPPIRIGIGINTGIVTAGQIGSDLKMEYTVVGDPVNLASRTESLNKPLATDILITEHTWELVKDLFITQEMTTISILGKEKPVRIFAVINFANINKWPQTIADVHRLLGNAPVQFKRRLSDISNSSKI